MTVLAVQDGHAALRIDAGQTSIYALQSLDEAGLEHLPDQMNRPSDLVLMGWQVRPPAAVVQHLQIKALIYMPGGHTPFQQSFADRWSAAIPVDHVFHPALHGRIDWSTDGRSGQTAVEQQP